MTSSGRVLVLAGGGPVGTAWMAGLVRGLRDEGVDLGRADRIIGTSAGAIVGAALAAGHDLDNFAYPVRRRDGTGAGRAPDRARIQEALAILATPGEDRAQARRRAGRIALADRDEEGARLQLDGRRALIGTEVWPERLAVVVVEAASGEPRVWDSSSGVPLVPAVTASSTFPGASPPIWIGDRYYVDGGLRSATNADLAAGAETLMVVEPLAHLLPDEILRRELEIAGAPTTLTVAPDPASIQAFGPDVSDFASWNPAYLAGLRQATSVADELRPGWR